jgi:signal transduction histidine kinase/Tfp pilus assembly protein PilF
MNRPINFAEKYWIRVLRKLVIFSILILSNVTIFCQNISSNIDSLTDVLSRHYNDTSRVNILNNLSKYSAQAGNYAGSIQYAKEGLALGKKLNYKKGVVSAYNNIGNTFLAQGEYARALEHLLAALKISEEIGYKLGLTETFNNIGGIYLNKEQFSEAIKNHSAALKVALEINNKPRIAASYGNLGIDYARMKRYKEAKENYTLCLNMYTEIGDMRGITLSYVNLGSLFTQMNNYTEAEKYLKKGLQLSGEGGYKPGMAACYLNLGDIAIKTKRLQEAHAYFLKGMQTSKEIGSKDFIRKNYLGLSLVDSTRGDFKSAYLNFRSYSAIKDSLLSEESDKQISQLKIKYETQKKDREIALLNSEKKVTIAELEKQRIIKYIGFLIAALIVIVTVLVLNNIRIQNKATQLAKANEVRLKISRDLHDEIGAGLTSISMICEQGKLKSSGEDQIRIYDRIGNQSRRVSGMLNEVVWASNPENDHLSRLLSYMRNYISKFFEDSSTHCKLDLPENLPELSLKPDVSRNLFYVLKEALNNCAKHSDAANVEVSFRIDSSYNYKLVIQDNGKGFDLSSLPEHRSGFGNMRRRIEDIHGRFDIRSQPGKGVCIEIRGGLA